MVDKPISLNSEAGRVGLDDGVLRELITKQVLQLLRWSLMTTLALSIFIFAVDSTFIFYKIYQPVDRLLNGEVLKILIGATVVQIGSAFAVIVIAIFKR